MLAAANPARARRPRRVAKYREAEAQLAPPLSTTYEIPRRFNRFPNRSLVKGVLRKNMRRLRTQIDTSPHVARINGIDGILHVLDAFLAGHSANLQIEHMLVVRLVRIAHALRLEFLRRVFRAAAAAVVLQRKHTIHASRGEDHAHDDDRQQNCRLNIHAFHM